MVDRDADLHTGSCLCGAVRFEVRGAVPPPDACHCTKCRKWSGHFWTSSDVPREALTVHGAEHVTWFQSSEKVRRGFCATCGSSLFFEPIFKKEWIGVAMGAFDGPTHTKTAVQIFCADKGDYYDLAEDVPRKD